jgi:hypothetical protein
LQQEGEVVDINTALVVIATVAKKMTNIFLPKLPSFQHIIVKNGHFDA